MKCTGVYFFVGIFVLFTYIKVCICGTALTQFFQNSTFIFDSMGILSCGCKKWVTSAVSPYYNVIDTNMLVTTPYKEDYRENYPLLLQTAKALSASEYE